MKKFICIALSLVHLASIVGGYWVFYSMQRSNNERLSKRLDMDSYSGSQAITIKLPLDISPDSELENYSRVDGEFEYEGTAYRLVKQKFVNDTAYIVCIKDEKSIAINSALEDYVKSFTQGSSNKGAEKKSIIWHIKDYLSCEKIEMSSVFHKNTIDHSSQYQEQKLTAISYSVDHPPEVVV